MSVKLTQADLALPEQSSGLAPEGCEWHPPPLHCMAKKSTPKRLVLVILSNRLNPRQKARFLELDCDPKGNILAERPLKSKPRKALFDEVWENDDGKTEMSSCNRFKRKYRHALEKAKA